MLSRPGKFIGPSAAVVDPFAKQIEGVYLTTITQEEAATSPGVEADVYSLKLQAADMRWFLGTPQDPSWVAAQGYFTITADQIEFKTTGGAVAGECTGTSGVYTWALDSGMLTLTLVNDTCEGSKFLFTTHPLTRQP